jgi:peptidyl-prolyl cis-trans isomerase A (cyclophilin A)
MRLQGRWGRFLGLSLWLFGCQADAPEPRFYKEPEVKKEPAVKAQSNQGATPKSAEPEAKGAPKSGDGADAPKPAALARVPTSPDPLGGKFTLKDALEGLPKKGKLQATIETGYGELVCTLYEDKAPLTVANFVGLARGLRPFWDAQAGAWVKRPLYDGTTFHRVIADFMIQGGDHLGNGTGDVGFNVPDEIWPGTKHDRAGLLCMANKGPNTNGGQFFITDAPAPHLTAMNTYTVFGECTPLDVVHRIARAPKPSPYSERPEPPVPIRKVTIARK